MKHRYFTGAYGENSIGLLEITPTLEMSWRQLSDLEGCTYLSFDQDRKILYALGRTEEAEHLHYFLWNDENLVLQASLPLNNKGACHIFHSKNIVVISLYASGTAEIFELDEKGVPLEDKHQVIEHQGSGPDPRQDAPHIHWAGLYKEDEKTTDFFLIDLGTDSVSQYQYKKDATDAISLIELQQFPEGSGPRHAYLSKDNKKLYVFSELSSELFLIELGTEWKLNKLCSTRNKDAIGDSSGGAIKASFDEQLLFTSNRGDETIGTIDISQEPIRWENAMASTKHLHVRDLTYTKIGDDEIILCANMNSSSISMWKVNRDDKQLTELDSWIDVNRPACIVEINETQ